MSRSAQQKRHDGRSTRSQRNESLVTTVQRYVLEEIIRGRLVPGQVVQLSALAEKYGVSRTPVREALALLEQEGLLTSIPYKGYLIRQIEPADVHDVHLMRRVVETTCLDLTVANLPDSEIDRLARAATPGGDEMTLEYDAVSKDFHETLIRATGSRRLLAAFNGLYNDVRRLQYAGIGHPRADLTHVEHLEILDALRARDLELTRRLMNEHLRLIYARALENWVRPATVQFDSP